MRKQGVVVLIASISVYIFAISAFASVFPGTSYNPGAFGNWGNNRNGEFPYYIGTTGMAYGLGGTWTSTSVRTGMISDSGLLADGSGGYYREFVMANTNNMGFWFLDGNYYTTTMTGTVQYTWYFDSLYNYLGVSDIVLNQTGIIDQDHNFMLSTSMRLVQTWNALQGDPIPSGWEGYDFGGNVCDGVRTISTAPVPEPSTMLLLGAGVVGLAGLRKKFMRRVVQNKI